MSIVGLDRTDHFLTGIVPRVPFAWIGPTIFAVELVAILGIGALSGVAYHALALGQSADLDTYIGLGIATFFYYAVVFAYRGHYTVGKLSSARKSIAEVTAVWWSVVLFQFGIAFLLKIGPIFSRGATLLFFVAGWLFLIFWRYLLARYASAAFAAGMVAARKAIVLGAPQFMGAPSFLSNLVRCGYRPVMMLTAEGTLPASVIEGIQKATRDDAGISDILLIMDWSRTREIEEVSQQLSVIPLAITLLPDANVACFMDRPLVRFGNWWTPELRRRPLTLFERALKRSLDLILATAGTIVLLPLFAVVALLIKIDSKGPVLFTQTRGGFNGKDFKIFKFRTLGTLEDGPDVQQVRRGDSRTTRIGRFLRQTSIDELPQLINVIRGEMSLVGPRPHATAHDSHYNHLVADYSFRHHVKPGLTGWAQVNGFRGATNVALMQRRIDCDRWYIDNWSPWLDIKIVAKTLFLIALSRQPEAY